VLHGQVEGDPGQVAPGLLALAITPPSATRPATIVVATTMTTGSLAEIIGNDLKANRR
jgi:hypothetical protein